MAPVNESGRNYDSDEGGEDLFDSIVPSNPPLCFSPISSLEQPSSPSNNVEEVEEEQQLENQTCDNDETDDYGIAVLFEEKPITIEEAERLFENFQEVHNSIPESTNPQPVSPRPNDLPQTDQPQSSPKTSTAAAAPQMLSDISHPVSLEDAIAVFCTDNNAPVSQEDPYSKTMEEILEAQQDCDQSPQQNPANPPPIPIESTSQQQPRISQMLIEYQLVSPNLQANQSGSNEINEHSGLSFQTYRTIQALPADDTPMSEDKLATVVKEIIMAPSPDDYYQVPVADSPEPKQEPESNHEPEPVNLVHITNQPNSEYRMRYGSEGGNYPKLKGKNGEPVSLAIQNADTTACWKAIICFIENTANSNSKPILHSIGLHFCGQHKSDFQGIVSKKFVQTERDGCLEMKAIDVATHRLTNNEAREGLEKTRDALERHGLSDLVELPNLVRYKSPNEFRLLFFIMKDDAFFTQIISEPVLNVNKHASGSFKINDCYQHGFQKEISMTNPQKHVVLLDFPNFPRNSNGKITAQFLCQISEGIEVLHPEAEITLEKVNSGSGTFTPTPFPTPHPTKEVKVSLPIPISLLQSNFKSIFYTGNVDLSKIHFW